MKTRLFKDRQRVSKIMGTKYVDTQYQCPVCKKWFTSYYNGYNQVGVKLHLIKAAKIESFAKSLGDIKKAPHLSFYKKNTYKLDIITKPREWVC